MDSMENRNLNFSSPQELAEILETLGMLLHARNRTAGGESMFSWRLAETVRKAGRLASAWDSELMRAQFGDASSLSPLWESEQEESFFRLLRGQETDG